LFDAPLTPGTLTIRVEATDGAGNTASVNVGTVEVLGQALSRVFSVYNDLTEFGMTDGISRQFSTYRGNATLRRAGNGLQADLRIFRNLNTDAVRFYIGGVLVTATETEPGLWELNTDADPVSVQVELDFGGGNVAAFDLAHPGDRETVSRQVSTYNFAIVPEIADTDFLFDLRPFARMGITSVKAFVDDVEVTPIEARPGVWGIPRPGYAPFTLRLETTLENGAVAITKMTDADILGEVISREVSVDNDPANK